ncbi:hypothetical protein FZEAL_346 [Fusarium zealandicum]|uniref:SGNH hydrolase-type esterase domain-containing protein n=1 Tax=Fusarium zealandicum TaxID=1053134 RepID=A0A8H4UVK4_9HYPO|nr:hypothetical protein FZEAL_346 [Fusarium zealandicum]
MRTCGLQSALLWAATFLSLIGPLTTARSLPDLRILPLGDSITKGSGSTDGTGYRKRLQDKLTTYGAGLLVDMVGSLRSGSMPDKDHEGHSGEHLRNINNYWPLSIAARPNVVLIHAGTNNMDFSLDLDQAPMLMRNMILGIMEKAPEAVVLVAPVIWANDSAMVARSNTFNAQLHLAINEEQQAGRRVLEVPIDIGIEDLWDRKHPNNRGYEKMAKAWFDGIIEADRRGWLQDAVRMGPSSINGVGLTIDTGSQDAGNTPDTSTIPVFASCEGGNWQSNGIVFDASRAWEEVGTIATPVSSGSRNGLILADLNGDGIADYVMTDKSGNVRAWINDGKLGPWKSLGKISPAWKGVTGDMIRMADVDNDRKADLIVISSSGVVRVWKNVNNGTSFTLLDSKWATGLKARDKVQFEDMDGDGLADYVITYSNGAMKWAKNTGNNGQDSTKSNWESEKTITPARKDVPPARVQLRDLNGDKKADYMVIYPSGSVRALRNTGILDGANSQGNWADLGAYNPSAKGVTGDMVRFADMDGDGLADFLSVGPDGSIKMWKRRGSSAAVKAVTGAPVFRMADLTGSGRADFISVASSGQIRAWLNKGNGQWDNIGDITPTLDPGTSAARIEFADVNGDGLADCLVIYSGGAVKAYLNNGNIPDAGKGLNWQASLVLTSGVGQPGSRTRFADVNGDGYADYLVVLDGGTFHVYLNQKTIPGSRMWASRYIAKSGGTDPASKVVFADITGDGKAEYIVQGDAGTVTAYNDPGGVPNAGQTQTWGRIGVIGEGMNTQGTVLYADIDGDGKDDYLVVSDTGKVEAFVNTCDWKPKAPVAESRSGKRPPRRLTKERRYPQPQYSTLSLLDPKPSEHLFLDHLKKPLHILIYIEGQIKRPTQNNMTYTSIYGLKSLLSGLLRDKGQSSKVEDLSAREVIGLAHTWHTTEGHYAHFLKLKAVRMFPFFFNPLSAGAQLNDIDGSSIIKCLRNLTLGLDRKHSVQETFDQVFDEFWRRP